MCQFKAKSTQNARELFKQRLAIPLINKKALLKEWSRHEFIRWYIRLLFSLFGTSQTKHRNFSRNDQQLFESKILTRFMLLFTC